MSHGLSVLSRYLTLQVQTALMKASRMLGSSIDLAQAMRGSADFAGSVQEDAASAPSFFGDRHHILDPPGSHKKRLQQGNGKASASLWRDCFPESTRFKLTATDGLC